MGRIQDRCQENPALTHYDDLGVSPAASDSEIREAYLTLVRLLHPDLHRDKNLKRFSELQMKRVSRAYAVLSDVERRKLYDAQLEENPPDEDQTPAGPRRKTISAHALITWGWLICAFAGIIGIGWFMSQQTASVSQVPSDVSAAPAPAASQGGVQALPTAAQQSAPAATEPNSPAADQDPALSELRDVKAARDRALEKAALESKEIEFLTSHILGGSRAGKPGVAGETSGFSGVWILSKPKDVTAATAFIPSSMDIILRQEHGILRGRYRAYYPTSGRPDPVAVHFYFEGQVQGNVASLNWISTEGAQGEIQLKLASENSLQVVWSATEPGTESGPSSGTALLVRQR